MFVGYVDYILLDLFCDDPSHVKEKDSEGSVVPHARFKGHTLGACFAMAREQGWTIWTRSKVEHGEYEKGHCLCPDHIVKR